MKTRVCFIKVCVFVLLLAGCTNLTFIQTPENTSTSTSIPSLEPTSTIEPTTISTRHVSATSTLTASSTPETPTLTPSWTPLPTLSVDDARELVHELLATNGGCELPCWWGITPGETNWMDIESFLRSFAIEISSISKDNGYIEYEGYFPIAEPREEILSQQSMFLLVNNESGVIEAISSGNRNIELNQILETIGQPARVWLYATGIPGTGPVAFNFVLDYPEKGIRVFHDGWGKLILRDAKSIIQICTQNLTKGIGYRLWSPSKVDNIEDLEWIQNYRLIEEVSNVDKLTFYSGFLDPNRTFCVETPFDIWP